MCNGIQESPKDARLFFPKLWPQFLLWTPLILINRLQGDENRAIRKILPSYQVFNTVNDNRALRRE
jgi:hypothetical protein